MRTNGAFRLEMVALQSEIVPRVMAEIHPQRWFSAISPRPPTCKLLMLRHLKTEPYLHIRGA